MAPKPKFELLPHTADIGIRARGKDLPELFANAALGMMSIMADPAKVATTTTEQVSVEADDLPALLVEWLNELIFLIEAHEMVFSRFEIVSIDGTKLAAKAMGEPIDADKHELRTQVKACTYHDLKVGKEDSGWVAQVIFDI